MLSPTHALPCGLALLAMAGLSTPTIAQDYEDFDSYAANSSVVGQNGWEEWGPGAGANVSGAQFVSPGNSIDINGPSDLVHQYSGYTSGRWVYKAKQYIPTGLTAKSYFILLSSYGATNIWAVQVGFNPATNNVEADAGGSGAGATTPILYDQWVDLDVVIDLTADWVQFYYNGTLLDDPNVPDDPVLGGGWSWTGGPFGSSGGPLNIAALDLYANGATSIYYDEISLMPETTWFETFDTYAANSQVVGQGGWQEWGPGAGALVSSAQAFGPGNSIDINGPSDLVHQYTGYTSGKWEYSAKQYIPSGLTAKSYFILLSSYGATNIWAVQVGFNPATNNVEADAGGSGAGATTPIVYDRWVDIQVMIDLDADWVQFYYDNVLLDDPNVADDPILGGGWAWTGGPFGGSNGPLDIAAVDLYANSATSVFYDDVKLVPAYKGVRRYGNPTAGSMGLPRIFALDDAIAPSTTFGFGCRHAPLNGTGLLVLGVADMPAGYPYAGIDLLINPLPFLVTVPVTSDAAGGTGVLLNLMNNFKTWTLYNQFVWLDTTPSGVLSASDALEILIL